MTQEGIAGGVWIDIRHVVQYVRPLINDRLVEERSAHVKGGRRKRKVYQLTDTGKLSAYRVSERVKAQTVRVRDAGGVRETEVKDVLAGAEGKIPLLEILKQAVHAGVVDTTDLEAREAPSRFEFLTDAPQVGEFFGREEEIEAVMGVGELPKVFLIRGIAGIGKSTLAARVCERLRGSTNLFWHKIRSWDTPESILAKLGTFLAALGRPSLKRVLREGQTDAAPQILREDLSLIEAFLVLDDAHDASPEVMSLVRFLKEVIVEAREAKLLVLTRRALSFYDRRDVILEGTVSEMDLGGLESDAVEALISVERTANIPLNLSRHPLFLKLLRTALPERASSMALRDIHQFVREAIYTELTQRERRMMKIASLYGVPVPPEALFLEPDLTHDVLMELTDRSLVTPVGEADIELHDTIRDIFTALVTDRERADLGLKVIPQLRSLASKERDQGNLPSCIGYLSNALELRPQGVERLVIAEELGDAREKIGALDGCLDAYDEGLKVAPDSESLARLRRKTASALVSRGEIPRAAKTIEEGFEALGERVSVERGWLHLAKCQVSEWQEEFEDARDHGRAALEIFESFRERRGEGRALLLLGWIENNIMNGKPSATKEYLERALDLAEPADDPGAIVDAHLLLTLLYAHRLGEVKKGRDHLDAAEKVAFNQGGEFNPINLLTVKGNLLLHLEADFDGAESVLREAEALATRLHSEGRLAFVRQAMAWLDYYREDFSKARERLLWFADKMRGRGLDQSVVESLCMAAECAMLDGDADEFERIGASLEDQELSKGIEARPIMTGVVRAMGQFLRGEADGCLATLAKAREVKESGLVFDPALPLVFSAAVGRATGQESEANNHLEAATQMLEALSMKSQLAHLPTRVRLLTQTLKSVAGR